MTLVSELDLPSFDHTDAAMRGERFHRAMADVRAQSVASDGDGWLARSPFGYMTLDREAGEFFLRTRSAIFPGMKIAEIFGVTDGPLYEQMRRNILHVNGADHTRLRSLVNPALSPRAVERYRPAMREFLERLLAQAVVASRAAHALGAGDPTGVDGAVDHVRCDFVEAFAKPYPSLAIAMVMGAPLEDAPRLHHWSNVIQRQFDAVAMASEIEPIAQAVEEFYEYADALVRARREDPRDDLISKLIAAEQQGDRLSDVECVNLVFNVLVGGVDTSQSQLAHAIRLLAEHPEQWALLADDPSLAAQAVEEALRYEPITPFTARILIDDVEFRGVKFPEGTIVMVCAFTANRDLDEDAVGDRGADVFDIAADRERARPLTFGAGVHYCLGANLARVELQEGLAFLAQNLHELRLDGEAVFDGVSGIYGLAELPIAFSL
ncbi:MAG TPA: cytochrome P450 [Solirubrobacteraceae bacterium]|jgi:cytochrome P450|nr:cytochrome P450 [Solirubrobacteraceae bacterium]